MFDWLFVYIGFEKKECRMLKTVSAVLALVVSLAILGNFASAQERRRREGPRGGQQSMIDRIEKMKDLKLTDDQKSKLAELKKEYAPKLKELAGKLEAVTTAEQKKARDEAMKAAKAAGKKGREVFEAGTAALKLTDEQKAKTAECFKAMGELNKEIRDKVTKLLTPEQQEVLKKARGNMRGPRREVN
jgi:Spy/CpxP family protein refolding chaperone